MVQQTKTLLEQFSKSNSVEERTNFLKDAYIGETLYIVAAGPSLNNYSPNKLKSFLADKPVMCIKQSYHMLKDVTDFLLLNFTNLSNYSWKEDVITAWTFWFEQHPEIVFKNKWKADLLFPVYRNENKENKISQTVAYQKDYENLLFDKSMARPWGPGLMYELAIPLAVHMGIKEIVTIGWDIGDISLWKDINDKGERHEIEHFYSEETQRYDTFTLDAQEIQLITESSVEIYRFLKNIGIDFKIASDINPASKEIPRIDLNNLL